ncbi:hypothetical protein SAMN03159294_1351 [Kosakonia radicincitans]|nr:hypothetical protein SAMN03159294_1351 [Kosakonia radicincitans]
MMARDTHPCYISNEKDSAKKNCYTSIPQLSIETVTRDDLLSLLNQPR